MSFAVRATLLGLGLFMALTSMVLIAFSTAGFSFNQGAVRSAYFAKANQPTWQFKVNGVTLGISGFNIDVLYGLRLYTVVCDGSRCNDKGDDIIEPVSSYRWQNCDYDDDEGPFADHTVCYDCRAAGLATGAFIILSLFVAVPAVVVMAARFSTKVDNVFLRIAGVAMHLVIFVFELVAISIYGGLCYKNLGDLYDGDDIVDAGDVDYSLGPGMIACIVVLLFQPFLIVFHAATPHNDDSDGNNGNNAGGATGSGSMAGQERI